MRPKNIALVGISGVGKTTFSRKLSSLVCVLPVSASGLIMLGLSKSSNKVWTKEEIRVSKTDAMQDILVAEYTEIRKNSDLPIILDSHVLIYKNQYSEKIRPSFFSRLNTDLLVHLTSDPRLIYNRRERQPERKRPYLSITELRNHQNESASIAANIGLALNIPSVKIDVEEEAKLAKVLYPEFDLSLTKEKAGKL